MVHAEGLYRSGALRLDVQEIGLQLAELSDADAGMPSWDVEPWEHAAHLTRADGPATEYADSGDYTYTQLRHTGA